MSMIVNPLWGGFALAFLGKLLQPDVCWAAVMKRTTNHAFYLFILLRYLGPFALVFLKAACTQVGFFSGVCP